MDLNLLVVFHHVAECQSVTVAADRLALSQPAVSHALNRLRQLFDDPLFVREKGGLGLTRRAMELVEPVRGVLDAVESVLAPRTFDPSTTRRRFRIGASEYVSATLLPPIASALHAAAPHASFAFEAVDASVFEHLAKGEFEAVFWGTTPPADPFVVTELFREPHVGAVGSHHPLAAQARSGTVGLEDYLSFPHWRVNYAASMPSVIDQTLNDMGRVRRVALETASFGSNTALLDDARLILTLPSRVFKGKNRDDVIVFSLPFASPEFIYYLIWHPRSKSDPGSLWLRSQLIREVEKEL
ncbi:LysR family transcriptional regulator [Methylobacterium sp. C1]|uniref:LysR family transcriptional regulator n=1 Tax=Methylobacterium sp. C1 TaxID=1479019 RepID=UPI0013315096|nr:LysR family transcriptional regulator [Methylobacterium sp. C1]